MSKSADAFRTISEVAEWLDTPAHVLRFWESKFTQVKPVKRAGGRRYYRPQDMFLLGGIKRLLHDDGMTIKNVQKLLRQEGVKHVAAMSQPLDGDLAGIAPPTPPAPKPAPEVTPDPVEPAVEVAEEPAQEAAAEAPAAPEPVMEAAPAEPEPTPEPVAEDPAPAMEPPAEPEPLPEPELAQSTEELGPAPSFLSSPGLASASEETPEPEEAAAPEAEPEAPEVPAAAIVLGADLPDTDPTAPAPSESVLSDVARLNGKLTAAQAATLAPHVARLEELLAQA